LKVQLKILDFIVRVDICKIPGYRVSDPMYGKAWYLLRIERSKVQFRVLDFIVRVDICEILSYRVSDPLYFLVGDAHDVFPASGDTFDHIFCLIFDIEILNGRVLSYF